MEPSENIVVEIPENEPGCMQRSRAFASTRLIQIEPVEVAVSGKKSVRRGEKAAAESVVPPVLTSKSWAENQLDQLRQFRHKQAEQLQEKQESRRRDAKKAPNLAAAGAGRIVNNWIPIGPSAVRKGQTANQATTSGRVAGLAVLPGGRRVYAASANGGVWRSIDAGNSWVPLMDTPTTSFDIDPGAPPLTPLNNRADSLACGAIAVVPGTTANEDVIFVGSGEPFGNYSMFGVGPVVSSDGGQTWQTEDCIPPNSLLGQGFYGLVIDPDDATRILGATTNGLYIRTPKGGGAAGFDWVRSGVPPMANTITSIKAARRGGVKFFYAADQTDVFESADNGLNWNPMGAWTPLPGPGAATPPPVTNGRISLAVKADNTDVVYAFLENDSVWRWQRGGAWQQMQLNFPAIVGAVPPAVLSSIAAGQGSYDLTIITDPEEENRIYLGGSIVYANPVGQPTSVNPGDWSGAIFRAVIQPPVGAAAPVANLEYIGAGCHGDIHTFGFAPGNSTGLWVGCDGGVFFAGNARSGPANSLIFQAKNNGLQTLSLMNLNSHPSEDAILFSGTQDNGSLRFSGEAGWEYASGGDSGFVVMNWANPRRVLATFVFDWTTSNLSYSRSTDGGSRTSLQNPANSSSLTLPGGEQAEFYFPLVGTPPSGTPADANLLAFGAQRPWISTNFGSTWTPIGGALSATNQLNGNITSLVFANAQTLYAGTIAGGVYRYNLVGGVWQRHQLHQMPVAPPPVPGHQIPINAALPIAGPVTDIIVDPATPNSIYIALGGNGDQRHVWHFDAATGNWTSRSGGLLDVQHNALALDPNSPAHLFVGADIGIWESTDSGNNWTPFSDGLPDSVVMDLLLFPQRAKPEAPGGIVPAVLRAATHGRGVYERTLEPSKLPVELYIRHTILDQGRYPSEDGLQNPIAAVGQLVNHAQSIDIRIDTSNAQGHYQFPADPARTIDFVQFIDQLNDQSLHVPTHARLDLVSRVYVQIHNRGVQPADGVRVLLLKKEAAGTPAVVGNLPANWRDSLRDNIPIEADGWSTVGMKTVHGVRVGFPSVVPFELPSSFLPRPVDLPGREQFVLVALVWHPTDSQFLLAPAQNDAHQITRQERKAAMKVCRAELFAGVFPTLNRNLPMAGFVRIPASATAANAPFDAFLAESLRLNDVFFEKNLQMLFAGPMTAANFEGEITTAAAHDPRKILNGSIIRHDVAFDLLPGLPLIWFASQRIILSANINGKGKGAPAGEDGDFGGSGGGGVAAGKACKMPVSGHQFLDGGGPDLPGNELPIDWASRALAVSMLCRGGASGGSSAIGGAARGGAGGGVVFLFAPVIEFAGGAAIDVSGDSDIAGGKTGGGGGGLVVLVAGEIINRTPANILTTGGAGANGGGNGGNGLLFIKTWHLPSS